MCVIRKWGETEDLSSKNELYIIRVIIERNTYYIFWYMDDEEDKVLLDTCDKLIFFTDEELASLVVVENGYEINDEIFSMSWNILEELKNEIINCETVLNYWNILSDVAHSIKAHFIGDKKNGMIQNIYEKLFYGCNLPAIKKSEKEYIPQWTEEEKNGIIEVIENGFDILIAAFKSGNSPKSKEV